MGDHDLDDIPAYLRISQDERRAAWDEYRAAHRPLPAERPAYRSINDGLPLPDIKT